LRGNRTGKEVLSSRLIAITAYLMVGFLGVCKPCGKQIMQSTPTPKSNHSNRLAVRPIGEEPFGENLLSGPCPH